MTHYRGDCLIETAKDQGRDENLNYLYGYHEPGGSLPAGSWICFTHELGHDPSHQGGFDYTPWAQYNILARLNNGYHPHGTIPLPDQYEDFAKRVENWARNSQGCDKWIIGNEPNHSQEWPEGSPILKELYVECFNRCTARIGPAIPAAIAPWNVETGDWLTYFQYIMENALGVKGVALHTYTHGDDPSLITNMETMDPPFVDRFFHFRAYVNFMPYIPEYLPVYITETNKDMPWPDHNNGWVQEAYKEVDRWNKTEKPTIHCLCLYRWPHYDDKWIVGKQRVIEDMKEAVEHGYHVDDPCPEPPPIGPPTSRECLIDKLMVAKRQEAKILEVAYAEIGELYAT